MQKIALTYYSIFMDSIQLYACVLMLITHKTDHIISNQYAQYTKSILLLNDKLSQRSLYNKFDNLQFIFNNIQLAPTVIFQ